MNLYAKIAVPIIAAFEGCAIKYRGMVYPYLDKLAKPPRWTRGFGRTYGITESSDPITQAAAKAELAVGVQRVAFACIKLAPILAYKPECLAAVVSWTWNCGLGAFKVSRLRKAINEQRWDDAARHMLTPKTAGGVVVNGLAKRRIIESKLFLSGVRSHPPQ